MAHNYDLVVVGSGIAGLMTTKKASSLGIQTLLIEKNDRVAGGSSIRNEGWLHAGTYHSISIKDRSNAIQVAKRSLYGHQQIKSYAPEVVEDPLNKSVCLIKESDNLEEILDRWNEAGVANKEVNRVNFFRRRSEIKKDKVTNIFEVADISINTRILYARLLQDAQLYGATICTNSELKFDSQRNAFLISNGQFHKIESRLFIYTAGYGSGNISKKELGIELPLRYWKSHLMITPRLTDTGVFNLSPGEVALMNHNHCSIIGFNEDAYLVNEPNLDVDPNKLRSSISSLERFIELQANFRYVPISCIKVDLPIQMNISRSLDVNIIEPTPGHIFAFPGKMTEAPYLVDTLIQIIFEKLNKSDINFRPCDERKSMIFCKEGIEIDGHLIIKKHATEEGARLEKIIAELYGNNTVRQINIPKYYGVSIREGKPCLNMEYVDGRTALGHSDFNLAEILIGDLALFHHMFSLGEEGSVLYRDSIPSNYIITSKNKIVHVDFSSCDRFIHAWDDVALLLNPSWSTLTDYEKESLIDKYIQFRAQFSTTPKFTEKLPKQPENRNPEQRIRYYIESTKRMLATGFTQVYLLENFENVDFKNLRREDFSTFDKFRTLRADYYRQKIWRNI